MINNFKNVKITFGIIVLNGEPFIKYNLRSIYPYAHQIIVVEGANPNSSHCATLEGHSIDGSMNSLIDFKNLEDPEKKVLIVTAEDEGYPNGFWQGEKDEQSQAYAKRATGNWLWQIDIDEFYVDSDIAQIISLLSTNPSITAVSFPEIAFWGSLNYRCDGIFMRLRYSEVHRLFKWAKDYKYVTHRPVTVVNGYNVDLRKINWYRSKELRRKGIYMYHYYKLFPAQVNAKIKYYNNLVRATNAKHIVNLNGYYQDTFLNLKKPFRIHTVNTWPSWLERFDGGHPPQIYALKKDIDQGIINVTMRKMDDVDELVNSFYYKVGILFWKLWGHYISQSNWLLRDLLRGRVGLNTFISKVGSIFFGKEKLFWDP